MESEHDDARTVAHELRLTAGPARSTFHGLLMRPHLIEGDEVETEPVTAAQVGLGDVVTYRFEEKFPTRRVVGRDPDARRFTFMGDSIPGFRQYVVPYDDVLARVTRRRRGGRWLTATDPRWRAQTVRVRWRVWRRSWDTVAPARNLWRRWRRWAARA